MRRRLVPVNFPCVLCFAGLLRAVTSFRQAPCASSALGLALAQRSSRPPLVGLHKYYLPDQICVDCAHSRATWAPHCRAAPGLVATSAASAMASAGAGDMSGAVEVEKKFRLEGDAEQRVALSLPLEGVGPFLSPGGLQVLAVSANA